MYRVALSFPETPKSPFQYAQSCQVDSALEWIDRRRRLDICYEYKDVLCLIIANVYQILNAVYTLARYIVEFQ